MKIQYIIVLTFIWFFSFIVAAIMRNLPAVIISTMLTSICLIYIILYLLGKIKRMDDAIEEIKKTFKP